MILVGILWDHTLGTVFLTSLLVELGLHSRGGLNPGHPSGTITIVSREDLDPLQDWHFQDELTLICGGLYQRQGSQVTACVGSRVVSEPV